MAHDPAGLAAAYLGGELPHRQRERYQRHLLECEACWREVQAARRGRELAESLRELAPQRLRERVRATVEAAPASSASGPRRRWSAATSRLPGRGGVLAAAVALLALLALAAGGLLGRPHPAQPAAIAAAVASYQAGDQWAPTAARPPARRLGGLQLRRSGQGTLSGLPVTAFVYQDQAGHRVTLLRASRSFPTATGARHQPTPTMWLAEVDRVVLLCADRPWPSLVVGQDRAEVLQAAAQLGLH
jgi:anti-sigma factor RsiW